MLRITQGTPTEFQVFVFCGIVLFVTMAPIVILTASLLGYLTRATPAGAGTTPQAAPMPETPAVESYNFAARVAHDHGHFEPCGTRCEQMSHAVSGAA